MAQRMTQRLAGVMGGPSPSTPFPPLADGAGRTRSGPPATHLPAPGSFRILIGLLLCLPGGIVLALGAFLIGPGVALVLSGLRRFRRGPERPETLRPSIYWPAKGGQC